MTSSLVIGLGSDHGDDNAGWIVIDRLQDRGYPRECSLRVLHPADLLDVVSPMQSLILCDACQAMKGAGTIHRFDWPKNPCNYPRASGLHDLSLLEVLELGRQLGLMPNEVTIYAIEGESWIPGTPAAHKIHTVADQVAQAISEICVKN